MREKAGSACRRVQPHSTAVGMVFDVAAAAAAAAATDDDDHKFSSGPL